MRTNYSYLQRKEKTNVENKISAFEKIETKFSTLSSDSYFVTYYINLISIYSGLSDILSSYDKINRRQEIMLCDRKINKIKQ